MAENLEKFRSTELYGAALEGSTNFPCRSSLACTSMESCQLADLKYAIISRTGSKTKKLPRSKLFLWTVLKHGLLEGSTTLLQSIQRHNSHTIGTLSIRRVQICNFSRIGRKTEEQEHSKVQKMTLLDGRTWSLYCGLVQTSSDKFRQVRTGVKRYFSSTVSPTLSKFGPSPKQRFVTLQLA